MFGAGIKKIYIHYLKANDDNILCEDDLKNNRIGMLCMACGTYSYVNKN